MTATLTTATAPSTSAATTTGSGLFRPGLAAAVAAAAATTLVAAGAHAAGVSFESEPGKAIPLMGFAQLTLVFSVVGILIARSMNRRASQPRRTFVRTAAALTALSVVPDLTMPFDAASRASLVVTHLVAAAIVVPVLARRLSERNAD